MLLDENYIWQRSMIPGYHVSRDGRVGNASTGREVARWRNNRGYPCVSLRLAGGAQRNFLIHRLVATAFIDNPEGLLEVNHIDGNKENCSAENLEWCSRVQNVRHSVEAGTHAHGETHGGSKLTESQVVEMRKLRALGETLSDLAERFGVTFGRVGAICRGDSWSHVGGPITRSGNVA